MPTTHTNKEVTQQPPLIIDTTIKERFGDKPLFPHKIEKAKAIMEKVRQREAELKK
jgi:hypothetical protein